MCVCVCLKTAWKWLSHVNIPSKLFPEKISLSLDATLSESEKFPTKCIINENQFFINKREVLNRMGTSRSFDNHIQACQFLISTLPKTISITCSVQDLSLKGRKDWKQARENRGKSQTWTAWWHKHHLMC